MLSHSEYFQLESDRLFFRALSVADIPAWARFFENNPGEKFVGPVTSEMPEEKAKTWINRQLDRYAISEHGMLAVLEKQSKNLIGMAGLVHRQLHGKFELEIGYAVIPEYWTKGYATEMALTIKKYAHTYLKETNLVSMIALGNFASEKVALRNGMVPTEITTYEGMEITIFRTCPK